MFDINAYSSILQGKKIPFETFDINAIRDGYADDDAPDPKGFIVKNEVLTDEEGNRYMLTKSSAFKMESLEAAFPGKTFTVQKCEGITEELNPLDLFDYETKGMIFLMENALTKQEFLSIITREFFAIDVETTSLLRELEAYGVEVKLV